MTNLIKANDLLEYIEKVKKDLDAGLEEKGSEFIITSRGEIKNVVKASLEIIENYIHDELGENDLVEKYISNHPIRKENCYFTEDVKLCEIGESYLGELEKLRQKYTETKNEKYMRALLQLVPFSYVYNELIGEKQE